MKKKIEKYFDPNKKNGIEKCLWINWAMIGLGVHSIYGQTSYEKIPNKEYIDTKQSS